VDVEKRPGRHIARSSSAASRWSRLTSQHVAIIAMVIASASVLAGWQVLRSVPDSHPVKLSNTRIEPSESAQPDQTAGVPSASTPTDGASALPASEGLLVIDVTGKVRRPGIVELPMGSRVVDALDAAGGVRPAADTSTLNLARLLVDGEQIVVGLDNPGPGVGVTPTGSTGFDPSVTSVNINTATAEQLETLPGVGPVTASAIIEWRTQHGAFSTVDELLEVSGIGEATLGELEPFVHV
jgi:competence protein ComEA